jgi:hypothetical protein
VETRLADRIAGACGGREITFSKLTAVGGQHVAFRRDENILVALSMSWLPLPNAPLQAGQPSLFFPRPVCRLAWAKGESSLKHRLSHRLYPARNLGRVRLGLRRRMISGGRVFLVSRAAVHQEGAAARSSREGCEHGVDFSLSHSFSASHRTNSKGSI